MSQTPIRWRGGQPDRPDLLATMPNPAVLRSGDSPPSGVSIIKGTWPEVRGSRSRQSADAGPTGAPWIDANGWLVRLAQRRASNQPVWLDYAPPRAATLDGYRLAVAEACVYGARWIMSLDADLTMWKRIGADLQFFEKHADWATFKPRAVIGVMSDFAGPNEFIGSEALNLLTRRHVAWRIVDESSSLDGLTALLFIGSRPPEKLVDFARQGGFLFTQTQVPGTRATEQQHARFDIGALGRGRVAVAREAWSDPYALVADVHTLISRRTDLLRLWNAGSFLAHYTEAPDGSRAIIHLLNYSSREPSHDMTLGLAKPYRSARLITPESVTALKPLSARQGIEMQLPPVRVYAAIEVS